MTGKTINITVTEYGQLLDDSAVLDGLQKAGVSDWSNYQMAFDFEDGDTVFLVEESVIDESYVSPQITISEDEYHALLWDSRFLDALRDLGLNKWPAWGQAHEMMEG